MRGSRFLSFAVPTIMGEVRRYFRDSTWAVRVPRRVKETQVRLGVAIEALAQHLGRMPKAREPAAELEVDEGELTQALLAANAYQSSSLEAACPDDGENAPLAMLDALGAEETGYQPCGSPPHCLEKFMRAVAVQPDSSRPDLGSLVRAGRRATFGRPFGDFSTSQTGRDRVSGCVVTGPNSLWAQ
ncbi:sigma-70 domain-containing protein [Nocardia niigatensis]